MSNVAFKTDEIDEYSKQIIKQAGKENPKILQKFLKSEGNKIQKKVRDRSKTEVKKISGGYYSGWKKSKVYHTKTNDGFGIMLYNAAPHAHLIEYGKRNRNKNGGETFTQGKQILGRSAKEFEGEFSKDCDELVEELAKGIG